MPARLGKLALGVWLLVLALLAVYSGWRLLPGAALESNILGLLPEDNREAQQTDRALRQRMERRFLVLVSAPDRDLAARLARELQTTLRDTGALASAQDAGGLLADLKAFYKPYRHQLLTPASRQRLQRPAEEIARSTFRQLHSPVSGFRPYSFAEDPFNLGGAWLQSLLPEHGVSGPGDLPAVRSGDETWYLVRGQMADSPFALEPQRAIAVAVGRFAQQNPRATLLRSGAVFHAAEATRTARREISTVGLGSLAAVMVLVVTVLRSRRALAAILFTLGSSLLVALGATLAVFERIHLITLAFGATLLGLAVDYCFHFLIRYQRQRDSLAAGRVLARGLLLGVGSSVTAYLIQLYSPFPGLHQFAVFMAAGLVGAALAVALLSLGFRDRAVALDPWRRIFDRRVAPLYKRLARARKSVTAILVLLAAALTLGAVLSGARDDIRALNASSPELLAAENRVRTLLGGIDPQRYFRVEAGDTRSLMATTADLVADLNRRVEGAPFRAVTDLAPPLDVQRADHRLVASRLYGEDGAIDHLCRLLQTECDRWQGWPGPFRENLTPAALPAPFALLRPGSAVTTDRTTRVWLRNGTLPALEPEAVAQRHPGVSYVDRVAQLSGTMADYRHQVTLLLGTFLAIFTLACLLLYGRSGFPILGSLALALAVGLGSAAAGGITLFHVLALLLVLGLAVDTAVFYRELGLTSDTWLAASMATLTSILAFGLLALSRVPVLHHFGSVVFAGLLCTWLVTPLVFCLGRSTSPFNPPKGSS